MRNISKNFLIISFFLVGCSPSYGDPEKAINPHHKIELNDRYIEAEIENFYEEKSSEERCEDILEGDNLFLSISNELVPSSNNFFIHKTVVKCILSQDLQDEQLTEGVLNLKSLRDYYDVYLQYMNTLESAEGFKNEAEQQYRDAIREYIKAFNDQYLNILDENSKFTINVEVSTFIGVVVPDHGISSGMYRLKFKDNRYFDIDQAIIDTINNYEENDFQYIFLYKDSLVVADSDFIEDFEVTNKLIEKTALEIEEFFDGIGK